MTNLAPIPSLSSASPLDVCDQCRSPLEPRQRYCVVCGSRRLHGDDPAARYLTEATRRARAGAPAPAAPAERRGPSLGTLALALIPLAAALGVLAGRSHGSSDARIIDALKAQRAPVINVVGSAGAAGTGQASTASKATNNATDKTPSTGKKTSDGADVLTSGPTGSARRLEGSTVSRKQLDESKAAGKQINAAKGKDYVDSQKNLPDQIVIP
jgi:hypothetical protein